MADRETIYRVTYKTADGTENYSAYKSEAFALESISRRYNGSNTYTEAILTVCERERGTWKDERVIATRRFDMKTGKEIANG